MAQGKTKVKAKVPKMIAKKQKQKGKGKAFTQRSNCPIQSKKHKTEEASKIKMVLTKAVNKSVESEMRGRAIEGNTKLSIAQEAVSKHHKNMKVPEKTEDVEMS